MVAFLNDGTGSPGARCRTSPLRRDVSLRVKETVVRLQLALALGLIDVRGVAEELQRLADSENRLSKRPSPPESGAAT